MSLEGYQCRPLPKHSAFSVSSATGVSNHPRLPAPALASQRWHDLPLVFNACSGFLPFPQQPVWLNVASSIIAWAYYRTAASYFCIQNQHSFTRHWLYSISLSGPIKHNSCLHSMGSDKRRVPPNGYVLHRAQEGLNAFNFMIFLSAPNASTLEPKPMERSPHPNCRVAERCNELFYHTLICTPAARNAVRGLRPKIHINPVLLARRLELSLS